MGSPVTEAGRDTNEAEHYVTLTEEVYLGKYEVTQARYEAVMTETPMVCSATPSQFEATRTARLKWFRGTALKPSSPASILESS